MSRHAKKSRAKSKATLTALAVVSPLSFLPIAGYGSDSRCTDLGDEANGVFAESFTGNVCQISFLQNVNGWSLPASVTKLSVVAVGGGGGAFRNGSNGFGGGGGQLNYLDDVNVTDKVFNITVGEGGAGRASSDAGSPTTGQNGTDTVLANSANTALVTAAGGIGGKNEDDMDASWAYSDTGVKVAYGDPGLYNNNIMGSGSIPGAGTAGHSSNTGLGGAGKSISDQIVADFIDGFNYLDPTLWAEDSEILGAGVSLESFEFGGGGDIKATPDTEANFSGRGGDARDNGTAVGTSAGGILIMRFIIPAPTFTVSFNANNGSGTMSNQTASSATALSNNAFSRSGYSFTGWNTQADGSGTEYADGASYAFSANLTLYAQWASTAPTPYSGPIPIRLDVSCAPAGVASSATLIGERLNGITSASVDGKTITITDVTATTAKLALPALAAGSYSVTYLSAQGSVTHQGGLQVCGTALPPASDGATKPGQGEVVSPGTEDFFVYKRFTNYRGDRSAVAQSDRAAIAAFIKANPGLKQVTCVGSTSGKPALETDPALATARANNACGIVRELVPGVQTSIKTNVGLGVGQFFRAVTLFGKGTKP